MTALERNAVRVFGKGSVPLVFAHGYGCSQEMWRMITPAFEKNFRIITFDYVGHGRADAANFDAERYATLDGYADDIVQICDELDLQGAVLIGHSVSAMIGVLAAVHAPKRISELVLLGISPRYLNDEAYTGGFNRDEIEELLEYLEADPMGWYGQMAPAIMGNPERPELGRELEQSLQTLPPHIAKSFARATFLSDYRYILPCVTQRSLVVQSLQDLISPESVGRYAHRHIEHSDYVVLGATGHCPNLSAPQETAAAIAQFLAPHRPPLTLAA
jgi:sigma-B regulation protein RsbQ